MTGEDGEAISSLVTLDGVRGYLRSQFNGSVRRPGMYGGVIALHIYAGMLGVSMGPG